MKTLLAPLTLLLCAPGCLAINTERPFDGAVDPGADQAVTQPPDLAQPQAKCAAAKGLPGDNLLCVDFSQTTIEELKGKGWNFMSSCTEGWIIDKGALQVSGFKTFASTCQFTLPALSASDYNRYNSFNLSIIHSIYVNSQTQTATISLSRNQLGQVIWSYSGTAPVPHQRLMIELPKSSLPNGGNGKYQPVFVHDATNGSNTTPYTGWQIESIAIQGEL